MNKWGNWLSCIALLCSVISMVLSLGVVRRQPQARRANVQDVYCKVVADLRKELVPLYREFGVDLPEGPATIGDLIRPLLRVGEIEVPLGNGADSGADN